MCQVKLDYIIIDVLHVSFILHKHAETWERLVP